MSAHLSGFGTNTINPQPDFRAKRDSMGKWTATQSYEIKRGDYAGVAAKFLKGELISEIYPDVQAYFENLIIEDHEYIEKPSAIDQIVVSFIGYEAGDEGQTEREAVYDYTIDMGERPIIEHPKFLAIGVPADRDAIIKAYEGAARCEDLGASDPIILDNYTGSPITSALTDAESKKWFDIIIRRGRRTYFDPIAEYSETKTDLGGLTDALLDDIGKIDTPPNTPAAPPDKVWFLSGASETRSSTNPITYSRKWTVIDDSDDNNVIYGDG